MGALQESCAKATVCRCGTAQFILTYSLFYDNTNVRFYYYKSPNFVYVNCYSINEKLSEIYDLLPLLSIIFFRIIEYKTNYLINKYFMHVKQSGEVPTLFSYIFFYFSFLKYFLLCTSKHCCSCIISIRFTVISFCCTITFVAHKRLNNLRWSAFI